MRFCRKISPFIALALAIIFAGTLAHRRIAARRLYLETTLPLERLSAAIKRVPLEFGEWKSVPFEFDSTSWCKLYSLTGATCLKFRHGETGESIIATVIVGTARNVTIAIPTRPPASYRRYKLQGGNPTQVKLSETQSCLTSVLLPVVPDLDDYRRTWCFSDGGEWQGTHWAIRKFADCPALAMVSLIEQPASESSFHTSPSAEFAKEFLPELSKAMFGEGD